MRKISSLKSRKLFVFDSYTAKQKAENATLAPKQAISKSAKEIKTIKKKENHGLTAIQETQSSQRNNEPKMYHVDKGSNFESINL